MLLLICINSVEDVTKKTPLASSLPLLQQRGSPLTALPLLTTRWGTVRSLQARGPWNRQMGTARAALKNLLLPCWESSGAFPQTRLPPKNSASCSCICFAIKRQENSFSYHPCPEWRSSFLHVHCCTSQMPFAFLLFSKCLPQLALLGQT